MTMTNTNIEDDIIDIDPETIVENGSPVTPKPKSRAVSRGGLLVGVAVVSALAGGWLYRDVLASYLPSDQMSAMAVRIDGLEKTSTTLGTKLEAIVGFSDEMKTQLAAAQATATAIPNLQSDAQALKTRVESLQKSLTAASTAIDSLKAQLASGGAAVSSGDNSGLILRLETIEKDVASLKLGNGGTSDLSVLSQSLADLKAKIAAGTGYKVELDRIAVIVPAAEGLDILRVQSEAGLPNTVGLGQELTLLAAQLRSAPPPGDTTEPGWWDYAASLASGLVTIKASGVVDWSQMALQSAALASQGDLAGAIKTLEVSEGALPVDLQKWHDRAVARIQMEQALEKTSSAVARQIAAKG